MAMTESWTHKSVCRLCLTNNGNFLEIFGQEGVRLDISSILTKHFWFEVTQNDSLPQVICTNCWHPIEVFHELYLIVEQKYKTFYGKFIDAEDNLINDIEQININIETSLAGKNTIEQLPTDDEHFLTDDDRSDNSKEYIPPKRKPKLKQKNDIKLSKTRKTKAKKLLQKTESINVPIEKKKIVKKLRIEAVKNNEIVRKHFKMICDICEYSFDTFSAAKKHHIDVHKQKGYLMCCEKKFSKLYSILQHCKWHENPEVFRCEHCPKTFTGSSGLRHHLHSVHTSAAEKTFLCDLCPKSFSLEFMLTKHKRMQHISEADKKFACDICGQKFILFAFLKAHIKKVHENSDSRMCDICAKFFKCSKSYELHYISVHTNIQQKVRCELCGKWLKHEYGLKDHMRRHSASNEKCKFCGRISANKKSLSAHIRTVHRDPIHKCTICDKMFKRTKTLKEHMAIHSGRTDLYTCTYCPKTFRSSANMYSHRKRSHPTEYEENKIQGSYNAKIVVDESVACQ